MTQIAAKSSFLPDFCGVRMVFVVVLIGELLAILLTLAETIAVRDSASNLALISLFIQWMGLSSVAALCITRPWLNAMPDHWAASGSYLLVLTVCLMITELAWWAVQRTPLLTGLIPETHGLFVLRCMGISAIVSALSLRYFYVQHQWRRNIESEAAARIDALQARIRPHFLFNCMNTIASLTRKQPRLAEEAIEDLSDLFRVTLKDSGNLSTWRDELALCQRYVRIESHRLGDRLQVIWDIDVLPGTARLPALTLQPLIENAIYHGIEPLVEGGTIHITGSQDGNRIWFSINNPLPPAGMEQHHHTGNKVALENTQQRLSACFGAGGKLETRIEGNRYIATVTIPCPDENPDR